MTAYQEDLLSLDDLRRRMPELRKREQAIGVELSAIQSQLADRAGYLRLADTMRSTACDCAQWRYPRDLGVKTQAHDPDLGCRDEIILKFDDLALVLPVVAAEPSNHSDRLAAGRRHRLKGTA